MNPKGQIWDLKSLRNNGMHIEAPQLSPEICLSLVKDLQSPKGKGSSDCTVSYLILKKKRNDANGGDILKTQVPHSLPSASRSRKNGSSMRTRSNKKRPMRQPWLQRPSHLKSISMSLQLQRQQSTANKLELNRHRKWLQFRLWKSIINISKNSIDIISIRMRLVDLVSNW